VTCPTTPALETEFYPNSRTIASAVYDLVKGGRHNWFPESCDEVSECEFKGPF
jgi:hypothetical protein